MKQKEKREAIKLRRDGLSYGIIAKQLGVSKSSVHVWTKDVELNLDKLSRLNGNKLNGGRKGNITCAKKARLQRAAWQDEGRNLATKGDVNHVMLCMLYWAEGRKSKNTLAVSNTDAALLKIVKGFVDDFFNPQPEEYTIRINCYVNNGLTAKEIEKYWLKTLSLPKTCLRSSLFKSGCDGDYRKNRHVYGVCSLSLHRTDIVQHIFGAIQEYAAVNKPEWLG